MITPIGQVRLVLQKFQDYYIRRDPALLDTFLELLTDEELEVIGTNGIRPGQDEWYLGRAAAREIFLAAAAIPCKSCVVASISSGRCVSLRF